MSAVNREVVRDYLAALLVTDLQGSPKPAEIVYGYPSADFTKSPMVSVADAGIERDRVRLGDADYTVWVWLDIFVFILYANPETGWTEANAEDQLDLIEKTIADTITAHRSKAQDASAPWDVIEPAGRTAPDYVEVKGVEYRRERIPVRAKVVHG